jgi:hypothetical protein
VVKKVKAQSRHKRGTKEAQKGTKQAQTFFRRKWAKILCQIYKTAQKLHKKGTKTAQNKTHKNNKTSTKLAQNKHKLSTEKKLI